MYEKAFKHVLYPLYESGLRRRNTLKYQRFLQQNQWKPRAELLADQWDSLQRLLHHAYAQVPYFRRVFDELRAHPSDIKSYADFRALPICSREEVVAHKNEMIARNHASRVMHKSTGGSTGVPVSFALDRDSYEWRMATAQRGYQWAGCEPGRHTLYMWGVDIGNPPLIKKIKTSLYHGFFNRKVFNCFEFTEAELRRCLDYINRKRPTGIVAFTTAVYNFAKFVEENRLECKPVPAVIIGAEKLYDHQRQTIERVLHTRVFNTYGCREFMLIAAECDRHEGLHVSVDNLFVEVLVDGEPAAPGQRGEIVITDLHNFGMPFIRYRNGDLVIQSGEMCSCGRGLPLINDVDGRKVDEIVAVNGKVISGGYFPHLMKEFPEIKKFQVIQKARDRLVIKLVEREKISPDRLEFCSREIRKVTGADMAVDYQQVDDIPLTKSGKYRVTISELAER